MSVVQQPRFARVDRWMARSGVAPAGLSWEGARLLDRRLAARRRAGWVYGTLVAGGVFCSSFYAGAAVSGRNREAAAWWLMVDTEALVVAAVVARAVLVARSERHIAAGLARRVAADRAIPTWRRVGALRVLNGLLVLGASIGVLAGLAASGATASVVAAYAVLLAAALGTAVLLGARELTRPALAVDEGTLRVDDRWRSQALSIALIPLALLFLPSAFLRVGSGQVVPGWVSAVDVAATITGLVVGLLEQLAQAADRRSLRPTSSTARTCL